MSRNRRGARAASTHMRTGNVFHDRHHDLDLDLTMFGKTHVSITTRMRDSTELIVDPNVIHQNISYEVRVETIELPQTSSGDSLSAAKFPPRVHMAR